MINPNTLELAKLGDATAIASAISYTLQDKGIAAKALLKNDCLMVMLESAQVPDREISVSSIHKLLMKLAVPFINSVKIFGKETGKNSAAWTESFTLNLQVAEEKTEEIKQSTWPAWFPSPSSWIRTFALVLWIAVVLRITGFWGIVFGTILSELAQHPGPLLRLLGIALLVSVIVFSYVHHFLFGKSPAKWPRWLPSPISLKEGLYAPAVMLLSCITVIAIIVPFLPVFECNYTLNNLMEYCVKRYVNSNLWRVFYYNLDKIALGIWLIAAVYLYQIEYLISERFGRKSKATTNTSEPKPVDEVTVELDKLRGNMGMNQMRNKSSNSQQTQLKKTGPLPNKLVKTALVFLSMFILGMAATFGFVKWPEIKESIAFNIASKTPSAESSTPTVTPTPETSPTPIAPDSFREAVNKAMNAAKLTQTAKSQDDWNQVKSHWQDAIALMKTVPASNPNYATSQKKAIEYQRNLDYATLAASRVK